MLEDPFRNPLILFGAVETKLTKKGEVLLNMTYPDIHTQIFSRAPPASFFINVKTDGSSVQKPYFSFQSIKMVTIMKLDSRLAISERMLLAQTY